MKRPFACCLPSVAGEALAPLRRIITLAGLLISLTLLSACSTLKLGYNALPDFGYWWADAYVDFDSEQSLRLKQDLKDLQAWHRQQELPRYRELLQTLERRVTGEVTAEQLCELVPPGRERVQALVEQSAPLVARLALSLSPPQIAQLAKKYSRNEDDYRSDWVDLSREAYVRKRLDEQVERAERLYGKLNAAQKQMLSESVQNASYSPRLALAERQRKHQDVLATLRRLIENQASPAQAEQAWRDYIERAMRPPVPAHREQLERSIDNTCATFARLQQLATAEQRERAMRQLRGWQKDLQDLAAAK
ncbi:DUF6279 family lipoprotein [Curvibacter sp. RS43]|uniref:DUF6279 family lipoprotein n=1 Tax=Curvibacter microcysteis TaxID=3026419 RepID=UPI00235FDF4D|nr:DUF6279 family lipoprotein [Curvibacter sp. RS43]MDD0810290.1 DUF6279 family lipoprotein [Curvibacter sp. RS43]